MNSVGSFTCDCPEGTAMDANQQCVDTDECAADPDLCPDGRCINADPGYYCLCNPGFIPTQDRKTCLDSRQGNCYSSVTRCAYSDILFKTKRKCTLDYCSINWQGQSDQALKLKNCT